MKWSALTYSGNLQTFIDDMRHSLLDIELVGIDIPPTIISYVILGKLMRAKGLNQLVDKIAMTEESVETPYLVLDALQTFKTHHLNKELNDSPAASALVTTAPLSSLAFPRKVLYYCANGQHNPLAKSHSEDQCFKKSPHLKEEFFKRKNKGPSNASASFAHATVLMASTTSANQDLFVLDLAASHNMLRNRSLFTNFSKANITIRTGDPGTPLVAKGHGTESIMRGGKLIRLENALYVPRISQQLISLVKLLADSLTITKSGETFKVTTATSVLFKGNIKDNLLFVAAGKPSAYVSKRSDGSQLWHHRLGHPSNEILRGLCLPCPTSDNCNVCSCSKMTSLPFSSHFSPALFPLHCLHLDLVGPVNPSSVSGFQYFLTCVDQFLSFKFVRFLKSKGDALGEFKKLLALVKNELNSTVKEIVSDRGGEFVNHAFEEFTSSRGIKHILAPPYTPEHNGFAEQANHTIIEKARCILMLSHLPHSYWAEAVNTATFVSNFLPTASRGGTSPYELWTDSPPPLSLLCAFGCLAYISLAYILIHLGNLGQRENEVFLLVMKTTVLPSGLSVSRI
jgi:transposase InsO family protein